MALALLLTLATFGLLTTCSSTPPPAPAGSAVGKSAAGQADTPVTTQPGTNPKENDPLYEKALQFDRYLAGKLELEHTQTLLRTCHDNPGDNIFCFSVVNYDLLEQKFKIRTNPPAPGRTKPVRPKYGRKRVTNWLELRFSPVSATLRSISSVAPSELQQLKRLALKETKCPNNAAISVAAALEEWLPERTTMEELATLYEKGADCIVSSPADRENLMTRAGLFFYANQKFKQAEAAFMKATSIEDTFTGRPLYWLYRTRIELKLKTKATQSLEALKKLYPFSFHTLVALTAASRDPGEILNRDEPVHLKRSLREPTVNPLIEQVEVLHRLGFESSSARVLDWAINDFQDVEPEVKIYLAELKKEQGDYRSKITILSEVLYKHPTLISKQTMELYFPKVLFPIFEKHAATVDPYLLLAIARRESAFRIKAVSSANARGLMQILPSTGRKIDPTSNLMEPDGNIGVGSKYILELLTKVNGQIHLALAAYNAGPLKLTAWTRRYESIVEDPILFIDLIPYRETREYVASVLRNYYWYRRIHQGDSTMTPERLLELANIKSNTAQEEE